MRRRDFLNVLSSAVAAWPLAARAQESVRRVGILTGVDLESDTASQARYAAFRQAMQQSGWIEGRNIRYDFRSRPVDKPDFIRRHAAELVALAPDAILVSGSRSVEALQQATRTIPIVFAGLTDPVGAGYVESLARPGGNTTGFTAFEYGLSSKWVELLREIAPHVRRAAVVREQGSSIGIGLWAAMQGAAQSLGIELKPLAIRDSADIERAIAAFAREPNGGMIITPSGLSIGHRRLISTLAVRHRLPAIYPFSYFVAGEGLISYGPDLNDQFRRAAGYVHRILRGEKPNDLPVQSPTRYELVINLKVAKALGIEVPLLLQQRADELIE
jgi:putative ABC transport system substrate-binding protein